MSLVTNSCPKEEQGVILPSFNDSDSEKNDKPKIFLPSLDLIKTEMPSFQDISQKDLCLGMRKEISQGDDVVISKYGDSNVIKDISNFSNQTFPSEKPLSYSDDCLDEGDYDDGDVNDISSHRVEPPRDPSDIFYSGRNLGGKDKLNECLLKIREFGFIMVVEKSEVSKGRYKLVCERGSRRRKKLIAEYDDSLCSKCFAFVNIHGWKINTAQMEHSHGPGIIPLEHQFMGLLHTPKLAKERELYDQNIHLPGSNPGALNLALPPSQSGLSTPILPSSSTKTPQEPHLSFSTFASQPPEGSSLAAKILQKFPIKSSDFPGFNIKIRPQGKFRDVGHIVDLGFTKKEWDGFCQSASNQIQKRGW